MIQNAPARVALAFLCFLMVLNSLNAALARLPALATPAAGYRVWLSDFLVGTMIFNFVPLVEFAMVSYGLARVVDAAKKPTTVKVGDTDGEVTVAKVRLHVSSCATPPRACSRRRRTATSYLSEAKPALGAWPRRCRRARRRRAVPLALGSRRAAVSQGRRS